MLNLTVNGSLEIFLVTNCLFHFFKSPVIPVMFELITRHVFVDDFNFTNNILVFTAVFVTAVTQMALSFLFEYC